MAGGNIVAIARVRKGMEVRTSDGENLGKVAEVWAGTDPTASNPRCDEELCSRVEVHGGGLFKRSVLYIPYNAIAEVGDKHVTLNIDATTVNERAWNAPPRWVAS